MLRGDGYQPGVCVPLKALFLVKTVPIDVLSEAYLFAVYSFSRLGFG